MKFEIIERAAHISEYDPIWEALLKSGKGQAVYVRLEGRHPQSVAQAMRNRVKTDKTMRDKLCVSCCRDQENDAVYLQLLNTDGTER